MPTYTPQDIRGIRKRLRLTQQEFGRLLGCSAKTVSSWESGYRNPSGTARTAITQLAASRQAPQRRHRPGTTYTNIHQWDNGTPVARYANSTEAAQAIAATRPGTRTSTIKHGILTALRGQQNTAYGYQWTTSDQHQGCTTGLSGSYLPEPTQTSTGKSRRTESPFETVRVVTRQ